HLEARVTDLDGHDVPVGEEGELVIRGDNVMQGYWNLPERSAAAFLVGNASRAGDAWYRTVDVVRMDVDGTYTYVGRRDRMIKRRGYRIELGEVEAGLYRHPHIREAAVVSSTGGDGTPQMTAVIALGAGQRGSVIEMKRFCAAALPAYMVPDRCVFVEVLPKTSTDKVDYQRLLAEA
ncbi:MAG: D-alanine--poly(phosphoribitol) ligase, partial [Gemmatimonadaceae bacterium]